MNQRRVTFPVMKKTAFTTSDTTLTDMTQEFSIPEGSRLRVDMRVTAKPTLSGTGTISLYGGTLNAATGERLYYLIKSVTISAANPSGTAPQVLSLTLNPELAGDLPYLPLPTHGIIKALSDGAAGAAFTIDSIAVVQEQ